MDFSVPSKLCLSNIIMNIMNNIWTILWLHKKGRHEDYVSQNSNILGMGQGYLTQSMNKDLFEFHKGQPLKGCHFSQEMVYSVCYNTTIDRCY